MKKKFHNKVSANILWLFFEKMLRLSVGIFVVTQIARYLQADKFGLLNYSIALVSIFSAVSAIGLNGIVVRDLITKPEKSNTILGTAFTLRILASLLTYIFLIYLIIFISPNDEERQSIVILLGGVLIFKSAEIVKLWFESQVSSKYTVWVESVVFFLMAALNILLIYFKMPLVAFIYVLVAESILLFIFLFYLYGKVVGSLKNWKINRKQAMNLLNDSWPLIISSTAWIIYTRIDQIMIGQMIDDKAVGIYSAATRISESLVVFPTIIVFSIIPTIMNLKAKYNSLYLEKFQTIYDITIIPMMFFALGASILSKQIIFFLFGASYEAASSILIIHIWSIIFVSMAVISGRYLINEGLQKITMQRHLIGLIINILLNFFFIPIYGVEGAAMSSLISLALSNYFLDALKKETNIIFQQKTKAIFFISLFNYMRRKTT